MRIAQHDIGAVSWSFKAADLADLAKQVQAIGLNHVQLGLAPLVMLDDKSRQRQIAQLRASGLVVISGMLGFPGEDYSTIPSIRQTGGIIPDSFWPVRKQITQQVARLAQEMGIKAINSHVGFVPAKSDAAYAAAVERVALVATWLADCGCQFLLETGQEGAAELLEFIADVNRPNLGVNFDPANLILYGVGHPIQDIRTLGKHIRQVHLKDAIASDQPGKTWGKEVPFGQGQVNVAAFLAALRAIAFAGPLVFERESGNTVAADIVAGIEALKKA